MDKTTLGSSAILGLRYKLGFYFLKSPVFNLPLTEKPLILPLTSASSPHIIIFGKATSLKRTPHRYNWLRLDF